MTFPRASSSRVPARCRRSAPIWPFFLSFSLVGGGASLLTHGLAACGSTVAAGSADGGEDGEPDSPGMKEVDSGDFSDVYTTPEDSGEDVTYQPDVGVPSDGGCSLLGCAGQCMLGRCVFVIFPPGQLGAADLAVLDSPDGGGTVFWTEPGLQNGTGYVLSLPIVPAVVAPQIWADNQANPAGIAVSSQTLYWTNNTAAGTVLGEMLSSGGIPDSGAPDGGTRDASVMLDVLGAAEASPSSVAVDSDFVYWTQTGTPAGGNPSANGYVVKAPLAGGKPITIADHRLGPGSIAVDPGPDGYVYWTDNGLASTPNSGAILKLSKGMDGGTTITLTTADYPSFIAVSQGNVYWAAGQPGAIEVYTLSADGTSPAPVSITPASYEVIGGVAADSSNVYWTVGGGGGRGLVMSVPINGSAATTLATDLDEPGAITFDTNFIYWADSLNGSITRLSPKP